MLYSLPAGPCVIVFESDRYIGIWDVADIRTIERVCG
jgi:hypothetical protein